MNASLSRPTGCPCGCRSVPGWRDPDCVIARPPGPDRANVMPVPAVASDPRYISGWRHGYDAAMRDVFERRTGQVIT